MTQDTRLGALSKLIAEYGEVSYTNYKAVRALGDATIIAFRAYLGGGAQVWGVPPVGDDWKAQNYNDAKYSTFRGGLLEIEPIRMGLALGIPHLHDDGELWMRVVIEFDCIVAEIAVQVIDRRVVVPRDFKPEDVERICALIYEQIAEVWQAPLDVGSPVASRRGAIGFQRQ